MRLKGIVQELIRYGLCGAVCTCVNILLFVVMDQMGMHYLVANTLSYIVAVCLNYLLNSRLVFKGSGETKTAAAKEFVKFFAVRLLSIAVDNGLFYIAVDKLKANVYISKVLISIVLIMATFVVNKLFVFKRNNAGTDGQREE